MRFLSTRRVRWSVPVALAVGFAAAGIAYATIPDGSGVIHGCYQDNRGTLRVIDSSSQSCANSETPLDWNQTGPRGPQGAQGPQGPQGETGPQGPAGPSGAGAAYTNYSSELQVIGEGLTRTIASVTLPPGSYTLSAAFTVFNTTDDHSVTSCFFVSGGDLHGNGLVVQTDEGGDNARESLLGDVTTTAPSTPVFLRCLANSDTVDATGGMIATQVTSVTPSE